MKKRIFRAIHLYLNSIRFLSFKNIFILLCIAISTIIIISSVSLLTSIENFNLRLFDELNFDVLKIYLSPESKINLYYRDIIKLKEIEEIKYITPFTIHGLDVKYKDNSSVRDIMGILPEFKYIERLELIWGRFITDTDILYRRNVCVMGYEIYEKLDIEREKPYLEIQGDNYRIIGVLKDKKTFKDINSIIFIPIFRYSDIYNDNFQSLALQVTDVRKVNFLIKRYLLRKGFENESFWIESPIFLMKWQTYEKRLLGLTGICIGLVILLIACIGIYTVLSIEVEHRKKEIGIMRAVGARRKNVFFQFITEAIFLTMSGWSIGLIISISLFPFAEKIFGFEIILPNFILIISFIVIIIFAIVSSFLPAKKATLISPIEVLRYE